MSPAALLLLLTQAHAAPTGLEQTWVVESSGAATEADLIALGCVIDLRTAQPASTERPAAAVRQGPVATLQVRCPGVDPARIRASPGASRVRAPFYGRPKDDGSVISEGYDATFAQDWHDAGITGRHVDIGVLDVGFAGWEDLVGSELPERVVTDFTWGNPDSSAHGTAVAEVIHDYAPDATLHLVTFSTDLEFTLALEALVNEGVDIVNGSVGFDNVWAADGTSPMSAAVTAARDAGVIYVAAAGNENDKYIIGELRHGPGTSVLLGDRWAHTIHTRGGFADVSLRWSEPFGSARTDLDLVLLDATGAECARSQGVQDGGGDPTEPISTGDCEGEEVLATLRLKDATRSVTGLKAWIYGYYGVDAEEQAGRDNLTLPADADGAFSVGAYAFDGSLPSWSSRGPTDDGRLKPDVVAATGVSTATFGPGEFEGTSASAPHASGLAALWLDATHRWRDPDGFAEWARSSAADVGPEGSDTGSGAGELHADGIPKRECGCTTAAPPAVAWLPIGWLAAGYGARRRR